MAHYILVLVRRSKRLLITICCILVATCVHAELLERVVAYVNNTAITLSEFRENAQKAGKTLGNASDLDIMNSMINRLLLIQEAKKMRLEAPNIDELFLDYIDIKIKSTIIISEDAVERFYNENRDKFSGQDFFAVREEIEKYLFELETNQQLKKDIEELRAKSEIKIQLNE